MSKHTPGPWSSGNTSQGCGCGCCVEIWSKQYFIASLKSGGNIESKEALIANAALIAAAPDMRDALEFMLQAFRDDPLGEGLTFTDKEESAIEMALEVMARTGGDETS